MNELKVGDKVTHDDHGDGEIEYGPYNTLFEETAYLVAFAGARHSTVFAEHLTLRTAFKVGDGALFEDGHTEVVGGPFVDSDGTEWFVHTQRGNHRMSPTRALSLLPSPAPLAVGDKIRILEDGHAWAGVKFGDILKVTRGPGDSELFRTDAPGEPSRECWSFRIEAEGTGWERVTEDTETVDGVTYILGAVYRDCNGDFWEFTRRHDGRVPGRWYDNNGDGGYSWSLAAAVSEFGPLTRVEN